MIYLIGENVFSLNSGTEFSQFQRLHALKRAGHEVKIVTRNYNRFLSQNLKQHGLDQQDSINMYDFFQKTLNQPRKSRVFATSRAFSFRTTMLWELIITGQKSTTREKQLPTFT